MLFQDWQAFTQVGMINIVKKAKVYSEKSLDSRWSLISCTIFLFNKEWESYFVYGNLSLGFSLAFISTYSKPVFDFHTCFFL